MLVAALFYATMSALVKTASLEAGTFEIVFFRAILTLIFIYILMRAKHITIRTHYPAKHFIRSIFGAVAFTCWFASMRFLPLGTSVTLSYTGPIFIGLTTIGLCLIHKNKIPWILIVAVVVGFTGICTMMHPSVAPGTLGWMAVALVPGLFAPIIFMTVQTLGRLGEPATRIVFYFMVVSSIFGLVGVVLVDGGFQAHRAILWAMLLGIGVCSMLAQLAMTQAYAKGNLLVSACLNFTTIPLAECFSVLLFKDHLGADSLIGMALILIAGITSSLSQKRPKK